MTEDRTAFLPSDHRDEELSKTLEGEAPEQAAVEPIITEDPLEETPSKQEESKQPKEPDTSSESGPDETVDSEVNSEAIAVVSRNAGKFLVEGIMD